MEKCGQQREHDANGKDGLYWDQDICKPILSWNSQEKCILWNEAEVLKWCTGEAKGSIHNQKV